VIGNPKPAQRRAGPAPPPRGVRLAIVWLGLVSCAAAAPGPRAPVEPAAILTPLWRDDPADVARVRIDPVPTIAEPSAILLRGGGLFTVSDKLPMIFRLDFDPVDATPRLTGRWSPVGLPERTDLEAMSALPGGEVLIASETNGAIFVVRPFPDRVCAAWMSGVDPHCFVGPPNCGIEALAVLPGGRLFVAKERDVRGAWVFDMPADPCAGGDLAGRTYLKLPDEVGPDISAAYHDAPTGRLLIVARARQTVLEFEAPAAPPGNTAPRPLRLIGSFSYADTEDALGYPGIFNQVEGIAVGEDRVLYLLVDNNGQVSRRFGDRRAALLRFFAVPRD